MGRLIDADALIILAENTFARPDGFIQLIEETETAYDVEKVIAEFEEEKEVVKEYDKFYHAVRIEKAIDIVKRGGVE